MSSSVRALGACLLLGPPLWLAWGFEANPAVAAGLATRPGTPGGGPQPPSRGGPRTERVTLAGGGVGR